MLDFLGPAEIRYMHKPINALFQFHEQAEIGKVAHRAFLL